MTLLDSRDLRAAHMGAHDRRGGLSWSLFREEAFEEEGFSFLEEDYDHLYKLVLVGVSASDSFTCMRVCSDQLRKLVCHVYPVPLEDATVGKTHILSEPNLREMLPPLGATISPPFQHSGSLEESRSRYIKGTLPKACQPE